MNTHKKIVTAAAGLVLGAGLALSGGAFAGQQMHFEHAMNIGSTTCLPPGALPAGLSILC